MIARKYILRGKENFERVEKEGKIFQSPAFGLAYYFRTDAEPSRFGFVISTKVSKDSVDRNRIKRALSEAVRQEMIDIKGGFDIVFLAKQESCRRSTPELMNETRQALRDTKIIERI